MLKGFLKALLGTPGAEPSRTPPSPQAWRQPPVMQTRDEIGPVVVTMTLTTGHHGFVAVVGESHYQDALRSLSSRSGPEGIFTARLLPEPDNAHDAHAVAVCVNDTLAKIGYLPRGVAKSYHAKLARSTEPVRCPAKLSGVAAGNIGIVLDFEDVRAALGLSKVSVDLSGMDSDAVAEYHRRNKANRVAVKETRALEASDAEEAVRRYRQALSELSTIRELAEQKGLTAYGFLLNQTDAIPIDRITICLLKLGRAAEASELLEKFLLEFPHSRDMKLTNSAKDRVERSLSAGSAPTHVTPR
jgi:hypothetical protein